MATSCCHKSITFISNSEMMLLSITLLAALLYVSFISIMETKLRGIFAAETFRCHMILNIVLTPEFFLVLMPFCTFPFKWFANFTVKLAKKFGCNNTMYYLYKIRQWTQLVAITWWSPAPKTKADPEFTKRVKRGSAITFHKYFTVKVTLRSAASPCQALSGHLVDTQISLGTF